jgi:Papain family cysteine protease/Domain of unknown function (DUF4384)
MLRFNITLWLISWIVAHSLVAQVAVMGVQFDDTGFLAKIPRKAPQSARTMNTRSKKGSVKAFAPAVLNQGDNAICVAMAFATALTIQEARQKDLTYPAEIQKLLFSYSYLYNCAKDSSDSTCKKGLKISEFIESIAENGLLRHSTLSTPCISKKNALSLKATAFKNGLPPLNSLTLSTGDLKKAIQVGNPVVIAVSGTFLGNSFATLKTDIWEPDLKAQSSNMGHCMVVVSYDDTKNGGSFEIMNSYGTNWGSNGYVWVKYDDLIQSTHYAIEIPPLSLLPTTQLTTQEATPKKFGGQIRLVDNQKKVLKMKSALNNSQSMGTLLKTKSNHYIVENAVYKDFEYQLLLDNYEAAYVYILNFDAQGAVTVLFPHNEQVSPFLNASDGITLPSENDVIFFDDHKGTEYCCVLFCKTALDLKRLKKKLETETTGLFVTRLEQALGTQMATLQYGEVVFGLGENGLELGTTTHKTIIPLIIEFEHK